MVDFDLRDEQSVTDRLRKRAPVPPGSRLVLGIGDDCAIYRSGAARSGAKSGNEDLLFTCDMLVEGVHFSRETHSPADLGHKALARSLSDIAAMGGEPRFCLVALAIPEWADERFVDRFFNSLIGLARRTGAVLAGGDLSHGACMSCDVTVCGAVPKGKALRRDGARPGDEIYVSGTLGGSALGLQMGPETGRGAAWKRHLTPEPRLELGKFLRDKLHASAAMDLSDGLSLDLHRLCLASGVAAEIKEPPGFPGASPEHVLHGGEDYELLFTLRPGTVAPARFGRLRLTRIGTILGGESGLVLVNGRRMAPAGYDHLHLL